MSTLKFDTFFRMHFLLFAAFSSCELISNDSQTASKCSRFYYISFPLPLYIVIILWIADCLREKNSWNPENIKPD